MIKNVYGLRRRGAIENSKNEYSLIKKGFPKREPVFPMSGQRARYNRINAARLCLRFHNRSREEDWAFWARILA